MGRKTRAQQRCKCPKCGKSWLADAYAFQLHLRDCKGKEPKTKK